VPGSWWTPWLGWLRRHSSSLEALPRQLPSLGKAPGTYVLQK
jgi:poly(3-hydroxyalkanoate) synthetase